MFVLLLLASRAAGEWVQIAQHPHRANSPQTAAVLYDELTKASNLYSNYSRIEFSGYRNRFSKIPNIGSVKRVHLQRNDKFSIEALPENTFLKRRTHGNGGFESMGPARAPGIKLKENIEAKTDNVKRKSNENHLEKINDFNRKLHNAVDHTIGNKTLTIDLKLNLQDPYTPKPADDYSADNDGKQIELEYIRKVHKTTDQSDYSVPKPIEHEGVNMGGDTKTNAVQVLWKLMKVVSDNISRNARRSYRSKIRYLENVQNNIITHIAERVELAWPDDERSQAEAKVARQRRAPRGHIDFPSSESALMTISFLTFAVFLIKLVLQVIHTYKNKTMMVTPAVVAAVGRTAAASFGGEQTSITKPKSSMNR